jgi:hypothetical protein
MDEKIKKLLTMEKSPFTEEDRKWLGTLEEVQIDKILASSEEKVVEKVVEKDPSPQANEAAAMKILEAKISNPEEFQKLLAPEMRGQFAFAQKLYQEHRNQKIGHILTNQATKSWERCDLEKLDTDTLTKLADSIKAPVDYSAQGGEARRAGGEMEILLPAGINKG